MDGLVRVFFGGGTGGVKWGSPPPPPTSLAHPTIPPRTSQLFSSPVVDTRYLDASVIVTRPSSLPCLRLPPLHLPSAGLGHPNFRRESIYSHPPPPPSSLSMNNAKHHIPPPSYHTHPARRPFGCRPGPASCSRRFLRKTENW